MRHEVVTITPEYAEYLLGQNTRNRKISPSNLNTVISALKRGEWKLNGEAIKVAHDGVILDGQHRLLAVVRTGIPIRTLLITGLAADTQQTMDTGKARSLSDVLGLRGYKNSPSVAATVAAVIRSEDYSLRTSVGVTTGYPVTVPQAIARLEAEPSLLDLAAFSRRYAPIGMAGRVAAVSYYAFSKIDQDDTDHFFDKLLSGEGLDRGNPILTLRNALLSLRTERGSKNQTYVLAITIKAWNKFRAGDSCSILRFTPGGANPEKFPHPQ